MQEITLKEQYDINKLLSVLAENGLHKEKDQVEFMVNYLDQMDGRFQEILRAMQSMKEQLKSLQEHPIVNDVQQVSEVAISTQNQVLEAKSDLLRNAKNTLIEVQDKGVGILQRSVDTMHLPSALLRVKNGIHNLSETIQGSIKRIEVLQLEVQKAGLHTKNIARAVLGKDLQDAKTEPPESGVLSKLKSMLTSLGTFVSKMEEKADHSINKMEVLQQKAEFAEQRTSDRQELRAIQDSQSMRPSGPRLKGKSR